MLNILFILNESALSGELKLVSEPNRNTNFICFCVIEAKVYETKTNPNITNKFNWFCR